MLNVLFFVAALQQSICPRADAYCREAQRIVSDRRVRQAAGYIDRTDAAALRELVALTQVGAPPFKEAERAHRYLELLRAAGADSAGIDEVGNVVALRRGRVRNRTVAICGHMDTVFPDGTKLHVRQRGDTLFAPGVGDNTRGLIALLQTLRALHHAGLRTNADLLFVGSVGEEGLGNLRGVRHLFRPGARKIDSFIAVDGAEDATVTNAAVGSKRYRVTFSGPGAHSWGGFGTANPVHALARAISKFDDAADRYTAAGPATTYNVGRIGGGTSVNAIATHAWAEVDLRSEDAARLSGLDSIFHVSMVAALNQQNALKRVGPDLTLEARLLGDRPSGTTASSAPLVQRAVAVTRVLGLAPQLDASSTDANIPISQGIPAITIGRGGSAGRAHTPDEWWANIHGARGIQKILYLVLAEGGLR